MCLWSRITLLLHINMLANRWIYDVVWYRYARKMQLKRGKEKKEEGERKINVFLGPLTTLTMLLASALMIFVCLMISFAVGD